MLWINFLHLYQPANIEKEKVEEATQKSYERLVRALENHPRIKFTLNITGCLVARWAEEFHYDDLIQRIKKLIERGQVELVGSAAYHPILPLIDPKEVALQIKENEAILKKYFGKKLKLSGFFFPEMAVNPQTVAVVKQLGYKWLILDEISAQGKLNFVDFTKNYIDQTSKLAVVFRNRQLSESYVPESLLKLDRAVTYPIITGSDAELYGLRHQDPTAEFEKLLKLPQLECQTISEYLKNKKETVMIKLVASSWQSTEAELKRKEPFILWYNKKNAIHKKLWHLVKLTTALNQQYAGDKNIAWARWHLVRGQASCVFWWASGKDFSEVFGPISWNPDEVERGINELVRSVRTLGESTDLKTKLTTEKLVQEIKRSIWHKHWLYYNK